MSIYKDIKTNKPNPLDFPAPYELVNIPQQQNYPPRAFQEYQPIAYIRDLLTLQQRTVRWLTGSDDIYMISALLSGGELSYGFAPFGPDSKLKTDYYGLSTIYLTDMINNHTLTYNFYGKAVNINQSETCSSQVNIEIRIPKTASNFGTQDGTTDGNAYITTSSCINKGQLANIETYAETTYLGNWTDKEIINTYKYSTDNNRLIIETPDFINFINNGTFFVITLSTTEENWTVQTELISGSSDNIILGGYNQNISCAIKDWQEDDCSTYKAKLNVSFNLNNLFYNENYTHNIKPHRFNIQITHHNYEADKLSSYINWQGWLAMDSDFNKYIKEHTFSWKSEDYLFIQGQNITYESISCYLSNLQKYNITNQEYIYSGNLIFDINQINNLYNLVATYPESSILQISTTISDKIYSFTSSDFIPISGLYNAQKKLDFHTSFPIKNNIFGKANDFTLNFVLSNGYSSICSSFNLPINTSAIINTLSGKYISNELEEYFYDETAIISSLISSTNNYALIIPGKGLFNNSGEESEYIRKFIFSEKTIPSGIFMSQHFINENFFTGNLYIQNCQITDLQKIQLSVDNINWQSIKQYTLTSIFHNNNLFISFKLPSTAINILYIKLISNQTGLICNTIKLKFYNENQPIIEQMQLEIMELQEKLK